MSEFSRETLLNIIETDHVQCGEASALARMALAAMDSSESVELPLDYLQGHKDGLEWAARLAEANHPDTGDWLYDDPIELAKAIRKGPDMPPAQPVADSEPVIVMVPVVVVHMMLPCLVTLTMADKGKRELYILRNILNGKQVCSSERRRGRKYYCC